MFYIWYSICHTLASEVAVCAPLPIATRRALSRFNRPWFTSAKGSASSSLQAQVWVPNGLGIGGWEKKHQFLISIIVSFFLETVRSVGTLKAWKQKKHGTIVSTIEIQLQVNCPLWSALFCPLRFCFAPRCHVHESECSTPLRLHSDCSCSDGLRPMYYN